MISARTQAEDERQAHDEEGGEGREDQPVRDGRLIVDEPTTLPEETVLDLVLDDDRAIYGQLYREYQRLYDHFGRA